MVNKNKNNTELNLLPNLRPGQMISAQHSLSSSLNLRRRKRQMLRVLKEYLIFGCLFACQRETNWLNYFMACAPIPSADWRKWLDRPRPFVGLYCQCRPRWRRRRRRQVQLLTVIKHLTRTSSACCVYCIYFVVLMTDCYSFANTHPAIIADTLRARKRQGVCLESSFVFRIIVISK